MTEYCNKCGQYYEYGIVWLNEFILCGPFCLKCDYWAYDKCDDKDCKMCLNLPDKPSQLIAKKTS